MPEQPDAASTLWIHLFLLFCYPLALGCLYHAIRVGVLEHAEASKLGYPFLARAIAATNQVVFFLLFVAIFWALESWAHFRTPFYLYDTGFPDLIPRIPFEELLGGALQPFYQQCSQTVRSLMDGSEPYRRIPLAVPLLEASLTYAAMWIAMLLGTGYRLAPFMAALLMVNVDAILDPVVAVNHACDGARREVQGAGIGLWHWYTPGPRSGPEAIGQWFGIPLFNYAAWWAAPVICISLVVVLQYFRGRVIPRWRSRIERPTAPVGLDALILGPIASMLIAAFVVILIAPNRAENLSVGNQWAIVGAAVLVPVVWLGLRISRQDLTGHQYADPSITRPLYFFLLLGFAALLLEGVFLDMPGLIVVAVVTLLVGSLLTWAPYPAVVSQFVRRLIHLDRFLRIHYMGFANMLVLLGAFGLAVQQVSNADQQLVYDLLLGKTEVGALVGIAFFYHVWGFLLNDVIDLRIDRSQRKRQLDPLVRGDIHRSEALALAIISVPAALFLAFLMGAPPRAFLVLVLGMLLMLSYNALGKRTPFPIFTDLLQAAAWACLALFGALAVAPEVAVRLVDHGSVPAELIGLGTDALRELAAQDPDRIIGSEHWQLVYAMAGWGGGFILLINGIHGGLRDLANDRAVGAHNTAAFLGARVDEGTGEVISNLRIVAFAYAVHLAMFILPTQVLSSGLVLGSGRSQVLLAVYGLGAASLAMLWLVVRPRSPHRDRWIGWHLLVLLLPAIAGFVPYLEVRGITLLCALFFVPLLIQPAVVQRILRVFFPSIADAALAPPPRREVKEPSR